MKFSFENLLQKIIQIVANKKNENENATGNEMVGMLQEMKMNKCYVAGSGFAGLQNLQDEKSLKSFKGLRVYGLEFS